MADNLKKSFDEKAELERQLTESRTLLEVPTKQQEPPQVEDTHKADWMEFSHGELAAATKNFDRTVMIGEGSHNVGLLEATKNQHEELQTEIDDTVEEKDSALKVIDFTEFSLSEIKQVTNNFDEDVKIGEGGFARVYKGFLRQTHVAIKVLKPEKYKLEKMELEFNQEVEILTNLRHPNFVSLIGSCLEARALIYEFLPNGNLDAYITGKDPRRKLSWQDRIRVASEICSALIYLHSLHIAHGDLKPENMLLDSNLAIKIIDFGISRKLEKTTETEAVYHSTNTPTSTLAYADPEFLASCRLFPQSDIYSFGIILMQLLTSRSPKMIRDNVENAIDTGTLDNIIDGSVCKWPTEKAKKLALLSLECTVQSRRKRPDLVKKVCPTLQELQVASSRKADYIEFSLEELVAATKNFDMNLMIGVGGFSRVYKGILRRTTVAIKVLDDKGSILQKGVFRAKFSQAEVLSKMRHQNLVALIGVCREAPALVYDYQPGILDTYLVPAKNKFFLPWQERLRIASEICSALIFLHSADYAHGALTPQNVLLDSSLVSKLRGFGLSRNLKHSEDTICMIYETERPKGSLAYIDPVYFTFGELTTKSDIFALGIILLQFVTGRDPRGLRADVEKEVERNHLKKLVDGSAKWPPKVAMKLAKLGLQCSEQSRIKRPDASYVYDTIETIKNDAEKADLLKISRATMVCKLGESRPESPKSTRTRRPPFRF